MEEMISQKADKFINYMVDSGNKSDPDTIRQAIKYGIRIGYDMFKENISKQINDMKLE